MKKLILLFFLLFSFTIQNITSNVYTIETVDEIYRCKKGDKRFKIFGRNTTHKTRSLWSIIECSYQNNIITLYFDRSLENENIIVSISNEEGYEDNHLIEQQSELQINVGELEDETYYFELVSGETTYRGSF